MVCLFTAFNCVMYLYLKNYRKLSMPLGMPLSMPLVCHWYATGTPLVCHWHATGISVRAPNRELHPRSPLQPRSLTQTPRMKLAVWIRSGSKPRASLEESPPTPQPYSDSSNEAHGLDPWGPRLAPIKPRASLEESPPTPQPYSDSSNEAHGLDPYVCIPCLKQFPGPMYTFRV